MPLVVLLLCGAQDAAGRARPGRGRPGLRAGDPEGGALRKKGSKAWKRAHPSPRARAATRVGRAAPRVVTLRNLHTGELVAWVEGESPSQALVNRLLRCRWTGRETAMDPLLVPRLLEAARHFGAAEVQVVSAFRYRKFNEVLRKKGHEVARRSMHTRGQAVDFRLMEPRPAMDALVAWLKARRWGGVGRYPDSRFVHLDTGPVRSWIGR